MMKILKEIQGLIKEKRKKILLSTNTFCLNKFVLFKTFCVTEMNEKNLINTLNN